VLYAKVVLGLPIEGPFDYIVPKDLENSAKIGTRVWVPFRNKKLLGFIVGTSRKTSVKNLKNISEIIDNFPVLDKNMLSVTRELSRYYCCSWGEAIATALPSGLRQGKRITLRQNYPASRTIGSQDIILFHDLDGQARWDNYLEHIKETLKDNKSAIIILPDINSVLNAKRVIKEKLAIEPDILYRKTPKEFLVWTKIRESKGNIVIGTRSAVFAPVTNLGLLIIDEEEDSVYKQEQVPHYNAKGVAFMRVGLEKAKLILGSSSPSLESLYLAKKNRIKYLQLPRTKDFPEIKLIDMKSEFHNSKSGDRILSKYLQDSLGSCLNSGGKALLYLNRKGFSTTCACSNCGKILKCQRCNINLVYHFKEDLLGCHYCNFRMEAPKICPNCNAGYIKFSGTGTEKIESELSRIFPNARINKLETRGKLSLEDTDICVATSAITKQANCYFDLAGVLGIDNSLNRVDLRSAEKTFAQLVRLLGRTAKKLIIQTNAPTHHCFQALLKKDINMFYEEELKQRKQTGFPPYRHLVAIKLRGAIETRVRESAASLFGRLKKSNRDKNIKILSVNAAQPPKLRGKFYWQILISCDNCPKVSKFLKTHLKYGAHSGIIVTVDADPI
jgi:primosomal protein N' (replication factor Y)